LWVLHLVADVGAVLAECARVLRPAGRFVTVIGGPIEDPNDELAAVTVPLQALRTQQDAPTPLVQRAGEAGLALVTDTTTPPLASQHSPAELAEFVEQRVFSPLWDLDAATWDAVVAPVIAALRALPDPERPRHQSTRWRLLVFEPSPRVEA
jgi:SAM-dependent methyltransferase